MVNVIIVMMMLKHLQGSWEVTNQGVAGLAGCFHMEPGTLYVIVYMIYVTIMTICRMEQ